MRHTPANSSDLLEELMASPLAALAISRGNEWKISPKQFGDPEVFMYLAGRAQSDLEPWAPGSARLRAKALSDIRGCIDYARAVVESEYVGWWATELDRSGQLWLSTSDARPDDFTAAIDEQDRFQDYAQQPYLGQTIWTSTELRVGSDYPVRSGLHALVAGLFSSDWDPTYPLQQARVAVNDAARVYEINGPADWQRLVLQYNDEVALANFRTHPNLLESGVRAGPSPNWSRVALDWDGVHLSWRGLLTSLYRRLDGEVAQTSLWAWPTEMTVWFRSVFTRVESLGPLITAPIADMPDL